MPIGTTIALIASIAGLAGTGISVGETLANKPGSPKPVVPTAAQTADTANKTKQDQLAALTQQAPNIQAATGGSLSPDALAQLTALLSGQAGTPGISAAQQDLTQKIATGSTQTTPGGGGLTNSTFG